MTRQFIGDSPYFRSLARLVEQPASRVEVENPFFKGSLIHQPKGSYLFQVSEFHPPSGNGFHSSIDGGFGDMVTFSARIDQKGEIHENRIERGSWTIQPSDLFSGRILERKILKPLHRMLFGADDSPR